MGRKRAELAGRRFGSLTVVRPLETIPGKNLQWECICECGATSYVTSSNLLAGGQKRRCCCLKVQDLSGRRFGKLTVLRRSENRSTDGRLQWVCQCDCGKVTEVRDKQLRKKRGRTNSCGCLRDRTVHGLAGDPTYNSWKSMIARCHNERATDFEDYGGRGISVCERWRESVLNFLEDMGPRLPGTTLDRKDPGGNYEPGNCRWATDEAQSRNKRNNRYLECDGQRMVLADWSRKYGVSQALILARLELGWSECEAIETPVGDHKKGRMPPRLRTWHVWNNLIQRCTNPGHPSFGQWGSRGIRVCERWRSSFENFVADMGQAPAGMSLERKNVDGNYEPGNCEWATYHEQARNTTRNVRIAFGDREQVLADWAAETGLSAQVIYRRIFRDGWSVEDALTTPKGKRKKY
jgi:hypothetical protein